jgi:Flp pilus assembly protein TadD
MKTAHYLAIAATLLIFLVLYFGCETKPPGHQQVERSRAVRTEAVNVGNLIRKAHTELPPDQEATLVTLEDELQRAASDSARIALQKRLSGFWYGNGQLAIAGHYAQQVAEQDGSEEAWSIAGTTFAICVQQSTSADVKAFCNQRAVQAFENAISLNPDNASHRLNLALTYTELPPEDNPMKGILLLRELQQQYPENTQVLNALGRLAIQTGQYARAVERLEQALAIEPDNRNTICLLAQAHEAQGNAAAAKTFGDRCKQF